MCRCVSEVMQLAPAHCFELSGQTETAAWTDPIAKERSLSPALFCRDALVDQLDSDQGRFFSERWPKGDSSATCGESWGTEAVLAMSASLRRMPRGVCVKLVHILRGIYGSTLKGNRFLWRIHCRTVWTDQVPS